MGHQLSSALFRAHAMLRRDPLIKVELNLFSAYEATQGEGNYFRNRTQTFVPHLQQMCNVWMCVLCGWTWGAFMCVNQCWAYFINALRVQPHDWSVYPTEIVWFPSEASKGGGVSKWVLPSNVFVCGHHSTVQAASSWVIAPRDMLSLINSESTDHEDECEDSGMTNWVCS